MTAQSGSSRKPRSICDKPLPGAGSPSLDPTRNPDFSDGGRPALRCRTGGVPETVRSVHCIQIVNAHRLMPHIVSETT